MYLGKLEFQGKEIEIREWSGEKLDPNFGYFGADSETERVKAWTETPDIITFQIFDGKTAYYIYPKDVLKFLEVHKLIPQVYHNYPFDADVIDKLAGHEGISTHFLDNNLIEDTSILYRLVKLAKQGYVPRRFNLALCCKEYLRVELPKDDDLRLNWGDYKGKEFKDIPVEMLQYGAMDVVAVYYLNNVLKTQIPDNDLCKKNKLSMDIQIKGDLALNRIYKRGIGVNSELAKDKLDDLNLQLDNLQQRLANWGWTRGMKGNQEAFESAARILNIYDQLPRTREEKEITIQDHMASYKQPSRKEGEKGMDYLSRWQEHEMNYRESFIEGRIEKSPLSTKEEDLKNYTHLPFIKDYLEFHKLEKLTSFLKPIIGYSRVHPRYNTIMNTGRTSCSKPNIQQLPREGGIREVFQAKPGHTFIITDYAALELATLAQVLYSKYGESVMRDKINEGQDLHKYYASVMHRKNIDEILKKERQQAKAANFGFPGGLGKKTFVDFARGYGLDLTEDEAQEMKDIWFEAFPEVVEYMKEPLGYVITETGRYRGDTSYCAEKNTPFQGLAADGAKLALYNCERAGLDVVAFVHDEIIIEVPQHRAEKFRLKLEKIMVDSMKIVTPDVKIAVESDISNVYTK